MCGREWEEGNPDIFAEKIVTRPIFSLWLSKDKPLYSSFRHVNKSGLIFSLVVEHLRLPMTSVGAQHL